MKDATFPILLIVLGLGWLLKNLGWLPGVEWLWILGLAGTGIGILAVDGITKSSIVSGPLLITAGFMSYFYQFYGLGWRFILPIMAILAVLLMLLARMPAIPTSRRFRSQSSASREAGKDVH